MKSFSLILSTACAFFSLSTPAWTQPAIIETRFATVSLNEAPTAPTELPLKTPTRINAQEGSVVQVATEALGELKPPFARVKIGELPDKPEVTAAVSLIWNLKQLPLEAGRYQLAFQIAFLNAAGSPGRMRVVLLTDAGKPLAGHSPSVPPVITFNGGRFWADQATRPIQTNPGEVYQVELLLDTKQLTWGAKVNGETFREELPFPAEYLEQLQGGFTIGSVEYQVIGGMGDKPGAEVAIGNVIFKKL